MAHHRNLNRNTFLIIVALCSILLVIDRFYWAQISQWREDQSTTLWLGYTAGIGNIPVGLISSSYIPNPNGMILLASFLSVLPNLLSVSLLLGLAQVTLLILVGWKSFGRNWEYVLLAASPALASVILRSTSVEFWNQYTIALVNLFFLFWALRYLKKPSIWNLPPIAALALLAPSLYLAGIVNAVVIVLITVGMIAYKRPPITQARAVLFVLLAIVLLSALLTWLPYFQNVSLGQLADYKKSDPGLVANFRALWESLFGLPIYGAFQWAEPSTFTLAFKHADQAVLTSWSRILLKLVGRTYLLQAVFAFGAFSYAVLQLLIRERSQPGSGPALNRPALRLVVLSVLFISLSLAISTWMGGPDWLHGERPDQMVQFLPMFLFFIFLLPRLIAVEGRIGETIVGISYFSLSAFVTINLLSGFSIIRDHLQYQGDILTEADVPLIQKMQAVDFIARDWKRHSSSPVIPVDYDLDRGVWTEVASTEPARRLLSWYPAVLTEGRGFDYELLRRYGLMNRQEGAQVRTFGTGRYLVTYAFEDPPRVPTGQVSHFLFGRLRVSIVEE